MVEEVRRFLGQEPLPCFESLPNHLLGELLKTDTR